MNVDKITMPKHEARKLAAEYREEVKKRNDKEDAELAKAYAALGRGESVLSLSKSITLGGVDRAGLPRFAICRADARECFLRVWKHQQQFTFGESQNFWGPIRGRRSISFPRKLLPGLIEDSHGHKTAIVPTIPPRLRPAGKLERYHILWEAEWGPVAPVDPILLRRIGRGDLFAILAQWDLTPLEQAALSGRLMD